MEWQRVGHDWVTYTHFHKPLTSLFTLEKWHEFSYLLFCILSLPLWDINLLPASCHSDDPECLSGRRGSHPFELFSARKTVIQLEAIITKLQIIGLVTLTNLLQLHPYLDKSQSPPFHTSVTDKWWIQLCKWGPIYICNHWPQTAWVFSSNNLIFILNQFMPIFYSTHVKYSVLFQSLQFPSPLSRDVILSIPVLHCLKIGVFYSAHFLNRVLSLFDPFDMGFS